MCQRILSEMSRVEQFLKEEAQKGVDEKMLRKAQCASLVCMLSSCGTITDAQADAIQAAIDHAGWSKEESYRLQNTLQGKKVTKGTKGNRVVGQAAAKGQGRV